MVCARAVWGSQTPQLRKLQMGDSVSGDSADAFAPKFISFSLEDWGHLPFVRCIRSVMDGIEGVNNAAKTVLLVHVAFVFKSVSFMLFVDVGTGADLCTGHAPHSCTHGEDILLDEGVTVTIAVQVLPQTHVLVLCYVLWFQHL